MTECETTLPLDFYQLRPLQVEFSDLELSSDAGLLIVRQADQRLGLFSGVAEAIEEWREPSKMIHRLEPPVRQRVYQLIGGDEDANDSHVLRHRVRPLTRSGRASPGESANDNPAREPRQSAG